MADELLNDTKEAGGSRPVPDPTILTTEQLLREIKALRAEFNALLLIRDERLAGIDKATDLRLDGIHRIPSEVDEKVKHLGDVTDGKFSNLDQQLIDRTIWLDERFDSIQTQFKERDTRQERESRDNKVAVDAAFAAQKESASEANKSGNLAISKSEVATQETINKLAELFRTTTDGLSSQIIDLKDRVNTNETELRASLAAIAGQKQGGTDSRVMISWALATIVALISIGTGFLVAFRV